MRHVLMLGLFLSAAAFADGAGSAKGSGGELQKAVSTFGAVSPFGGTTGTTGVPVSWLAKAFGSAKGGAAPKGAAPKGVGTDQFQKAVGVFGGTGLFGGTLGTVSVPGNLSALF